MKKLLSYVLITVMTLVTFSTTSLAKETCESSTDNMSIQILSSVEEIMPQSSPDKEKSVTYNYKIYVNGTYYATLKTTVKGMWNQYDKTSSITSVTNTFSGTYKSIFSAKETITGNSVQSKIYMNADKIITINYKLSSNGNMSANIEVKNGKVTIIDY